jgi:Putative transposase
MLAPLRQAEWVVYAKPPFAGPKQVLDYVGRYTHRVAISYKTTPNENKSVRASSSLALTCSGDM